MKAEEHIQGKPYMSVVGFFQVLVRELLDMKNENQFFSAGQQCLCNITRINIPILINPQK